MKLQNKFIIILSSLIFLLLILTIPNKVSASNSYSIFKNNETGFYYRIEVPEGCCLAYNRRYNSLFVISSIGTEQYGYSKKEIFNYSQCLITDNSEEYNWSASNSAEYLNISGFELLEGTCDFYPCYTYAENSSTVVFSTLPTGFNWEDDIILTREGNTNYICYYRVNSSLFLKYQLNTTTNEWSEQGRETAISINNDYLCYNSQDYTTSDGTTYKGLYSFFFEPPLQAIIPVVQGVEEIPKLITTVLKILIPVGLIVLGIGLVISVVKSVIRRQL